LVVSYVSGIYCSSGYLIAIYRIVSKVRVIYRAVCVMFGVNSVICDFSSSDCICGYVGRSYGRALPYPCTYRAEGSDNAPGNYVVATYGDGVSCQRPVEGTILELIARGA